MIPIEKQRVLCAEFMGWKFYHKWADGPFPRGETITFTDVYVKPNGVYIARSQYHPDLDDPRNREQTNDLKVRLGRLGYGWVCEFVEAGHTYWFRISRIPFGTLINVNQKTSEGSALVAAVAKLQESKSK